MNKINLAGKRFFYLAEKNEILFAPIFLDRNGERLIDAKAIVVGAATNKDIQRAT